MLRCDITWWRHFYITMKSPIFWCATSIFILPTCWHKVCEMEFSQMSKNSRKPDLVCKNIRIHHKCPCKIEITLIELNQGRGLLSPWLYSDPRARFPYPTRTGSWWILICLWPCSLAEPVLAGWVCGICGSMSRNSRRLNWQWFWF